MRYRAAMIAVCFSLGLLAPGILRAQTYQPGDQVVVVSQQPLRVSGNTTVAEVSPGLVLKVEAVDGRWVWLTHKQSGWLDQQHVVPLSRQAVDRFTVMINADPENARLYSARGIIWRHLGELDIAIADHTEAIRLDPRQAAWYLNRGEAWRSKGDYDRAIADYNEVLRLNPRYALAYLNRGTAWDHEGEYDKAIADYNEAIRLSPTDARPLNNRGFAWNRQGDYGKAVADYQEAISLNPQFATAHQNLSWLLGTCSDEQFRNPQQAILHGTKACELTSWEDGSCLATLAAAYAQSGDFDKAVRYQSQAVDLAPADEKEESTTRLELYQAGKPYVDERSEAKDEA